MLKRFIAVAGVALLSAAAVPAVVARSLAANVEIKAATNESGLYVRPILTPAPKRYSCFPAH
ncbi:MAG: hypothetical protein LAQ30_12605 [Acidobacteriia bacterium]|nr:hypothetical protein [Terriglobia bacterium]